MCRTVWVVSWFFVLSIAPPANAVQLQHPNRAALVMQDIDNHKPNKIYEGVVRWSGTTESKSSHVKANIDVGYFGGPVSVDLSANNDYSKPFSIIVSVEFPDDKARTDIERLGVMQARTDAQQTGVMLAGNVLQGEENHLIGLTEGDVNTNNLDLILNDNWLEIPILFKSGLQGKITFEKGFSGQKQVTKLIQMLKTSR